MAVENHVLQAYVLLGAEGLHREGSPVSLYSLGLWCEPLEFGPAALEVAIRELQELRLLDEGFVPTAQGRQIHDRAAEGAGHLRQWAETLAQLLNDLRASQARG